VLNLFTIERGSVFHQKEFKFEDGSSKDKYLITLNCKYRDNNINFVLTTSQSKHYKNSKFMIDVLIIKANESKFFKADETFIDLDNIYEDDFNYLENQFDIGELTLLGILENNILEKIEKLIKNSTLNYFEKAKYLCT